MTGEMGNTMGFFYLWSVITIVGMVAIWLSR